MNKNTLILLVASLVGNQTWAGSVTIPNTFTDGTTASADEVNDNFTAVEDSVDDNDARITNNASSIATNISNIQSNTSNIATFMLHSNSREVGYFVGIASDMYHALSSQGYILTVRRTNGAIRFNHQPLFTTFDCSGEFYVYASTLLPGEVFHGLVPNGDGTEALYYSPKDNIPTSRNLSSQYVVTSHDPNTGEPTSYGCQTFPTTISLSVNVMPFDEVITGFSSPLFTTDYSLPLPLTIEKK